MISVSRYSGFNSCFRNYRVLSTTTQWLRPRCKRWNSRGRSGQQVDQDSVTIAHSALIILQVGGLGHFGLLFAKALGAAKVVAISRSSVKKADATSMGADAFIATGEDKNWSRVHSRTLDLIVCTVSSPDMPVEKYLHLLRTGGKFVQVGAPEDRLPPISAFAFIGKGCSLTGSSIGSPAEIEEMLEFAAKKSVKPWIETRSLKGANKAIVDMEDGKARYRYVLVNESGVKL